MIRAGQGHIHTISVDKKKISYENKIKNVPNKRGVAGVLEQAGVLEMCVKYNRR